MNTCTKKPPFSHRKRWPLDFQSNALPTDTKFQLEVDRVKSCHCEAACGCGNLVQAVCFLRLPRRFAPRNDTAVDFLLKNSISYDSILVIRAGLEPSITALKGLCPDHLDERTKFAGSCLPASGMRCYKDVINQHIEQCCKNNQIIDRRECCSILPLVNCLLNVILPP